MKFELEFDTANNDGMRRIKDLKLQNLALRKAYVNENDSDLRNAITVLQEQVQLDLDELLIEVTAGIFADYAEGLQEFIYNEV